MKKFLKGFVYAGKGVIYCFRHEMNMRVHLCFTVYMFAFLNFKGFFEISRAEFGVLLALCALVLSLEAVNTALERAVNLVTREENPIAGAAKDAAAGAVLISAIFSVIAGIVIMYQPKAFEALFAYYKTNPLMLCMLIISIILSLMFVFLPGRGKGKKND